MAKLSNSKHTQTKLHKNTCTQNTQPHTNPNKTYVHKTHKHTHTVCHVTKFMYPRIDTYFFIIYSNIVLPSTTRPS